MPHITTTPWVPASRSRLIGVAFVLAAVVLWSTVPVGTRLLMQPGASAFSPALISAVRLWLAAGIFLGIALAYARHNGQPLVLLSCRLRWVLLAAGGLVANYLLYAIGLQYTTASATAVISPIHTVATVLLAALLLGERLTAPKVIGMLIAFGGVLFVLLHGNSWAQLMQGGKLSGNMIEVIAALFWPLYAIGQAKMMQEGNIRAPLAAIFLVAAVMATCCLPFTGQIILGCPTVEDCLALLFLGLFSTATAYWLFAAGTLRLETSEATMLNVLMPPFSLILAAILLHEFPTIGVYLGLVLVIIGLTCMMWRREPSAASRKRRVAKLV